jgi:hypothetical protein
MSIVVELVCMIQHVRYEKGKTIRDTHKQRLAAAAHE